MNEEIIIINDEPFYRIQNGTSYDYAPIPEQFKPYFERLQQENKILKENAENNGKAVDKVNWENQLLKKENQELKLELSGYRQAILEDKDMLGLKEENQELKKQLEELKEEKQEWINLLDMFKNQQKKFIEYLENEIKERKIQIVGYNSTTQLLIEQIIETEKMVLSKYREIIGGK